MLYIPVWIDLYLEVRLYTRSPLAFASLMQNSPQNRRSAPPRPPASQQEKDQSESRAVNPSAIQAHYRAKTSPAFHVLTVDGSQKPYSSKSKGSKRGGDKAKFTFAQQLDHRCLSPPSPPDSWDPAALHNPERRRSGGA